MIVHRWIGHLTLLGIVVFALMIARAQNRPLEKSTVVAAFTPPTAAEQEVSFQIGSGSLSARAQNVESIVPLANAFTTSSVRPPLQIMTYTVQGGDTPQQHCDAFQVEA